MLVDSTSSQYDLLYYSSVTINQLTDYENLQCGVASYHSYLEKVVHPWILIRRPEHNWATVERRKNSVAFFTFCASSFHPSTELEA